MYHYTNAAGFLGIREAKALWASDIRLLNDYLEVGYFFDNVSKVLATDSRFTKPAALLKKAPPPYAWQFVASFSEKRDLLSQWRAYTGSQGFAIGFSRQHILSVADKQEFTFRSVNYGPEETAAKIAVQIEAGMSTSEYGSWLQNEGDIGATQIAQQIFLGLLLREAVYHKHPSFAEEREWRLCKHVERLSGEIKYRSGARGIIPYVEFALEPMSTQFANLAVEVVLYPGGRSVRRGAHGGTQFLR
ncbi:DUF2971 domain-containing protein [Vitreimonas sp.]|uniref:DUF2971 domain-containing protein n=1 Tax=Vitreimonas sp. TaxID=3069702 RepID=UPI002EDB416C